MPLPKVKGRPKQSGRKLTLDPRQLSMLEFYMDPKSPTFCNIRQSSIRAGFGEEYAVHVGQTPWFQDAQITRKEMLMKAERNLNEALDLDVVEQAVGAFGPLVEKDTGKPIMKRNVKVMELKHDASKFIASRLGKSDGYSERTEVTGKDGQSLPTPILASITMTKIENRVEEQPK